jgi:hypothetical protein
MQQGLAALALAVASRSVYTMLIPILQYYRSTFVVQGQNPLEIGRISSLSLSILRVVLLRF